MSIAPSDSAAEPVRFGVIRPSARGFLGARDVKAHPWYARADWDALFYTQCKPPHRPTLEGDADTRHFDVYPDSDPGHEEPLDGVGQVCPSLPRDNTLGESRQLLTISEGLQATLFFWVAG